ncbi:hypothetical protein BWI96_14370 [Siphonobacter sp. SORGH_AS_0500]|uniref:hypothetical protein n=1 Tax=Siphonobacter sp. SORGH_AS_0500 TaxID=1864824 RepID=UPI000CC1EDFF|nr:hypothetical protein [Siphonobacter sp. SORGH_AS_0500]PKK35914.1 hypothetical protein BWI96_14295 [Siphonobacter sp. SORGH_AS_0500]PKK35923.1 hypothetical protein BWI96_14370 [Siphonobacter sp. SORGH_AS_0500]
MWPPLFSTGAVHLPRLHLKTVGVMDGAKAGEFNGKRSRDDSGSTAKPCENFEGTEINRSANDVVIGLMSITFD